MKTNSYLSHYGIVGQKWGKRNGPPYPLKGGDYSEEEKRQIYEKRKEKNSIYNKKHFDEVLGKEETTFRTLSYNPNRTKNAEYFYSAVDTIDKHHYNAMFNGAVPRPLYNEKGEEIGTGIGFRYAIDNKLKKDMKVASEDSSVEVFKKLYKNNRDFYNFVNDENRMESYFQKDKYKFHGYRESRDALHEMRETPKPTAEQLKLIYRMFNYCLPYDGAGDSKKARDMQHQRAKFFHELKKLGYGALLDTNDALYGSYKAKYPVIVFDMDLVIPDKVKETNIFDKAVSTFVYPISALLNL